MIGLRVAPRSKQAKASAAASISARCEHRRVSSVRRRFCNLREEPQGKAYRELIDRALVHSETFLLVVQDQSEPLEPSGEELLKRLAPFLIAKARESEWPGTTLIGSAADVYRYRLTPGSAQVLKEAVDSLFDWQHPHLPEDLSFIRPDGTPWLVTITHERDAYFFLT